MQNRSCVFYGGKVGAPDFDFLYICGPERVINFFPGHNFFSVNVNIYLPDGCQFVWQSDKNDANCKLQREILTIAGILLGHASHDHCSLGLAG